MKRVLTICVQCESNVNCVNMCVFVCMWRRGLEINLGFACRVPGFQITFIRAIPRSMHTIELAFVFGIALTSLLESSRLNANKIHTRRLSFGICSWREPDGREEFSTSHEHIGSHNESFLHNALFTCLESPC